MSVTVAIKQDESFLARDAFVRSNRRAIVMMFVRSLCLSGTGVYCNHTVHVSADLTKSCPPTPSRLNPVPSGREVRHGCAN